MAWISLILAGLLEVAWAFGLKSLSEQFRPWLAGVTILVMIASLASLGWSMTRLPLGVAYPIWTGIGSVGSVAVSVLIFGNGISATGVIGLALLIVGMVILGAETH